MIRFWEAQPWGPWRDNLHAAMIAREIRRTTVPKGHNVPALSEWMYIQREPVEPTKEKSKVFDFFRMISRKKVKLEKPSKKVKLT